MWAEFSLWNMMKHERILSRLNEPNEETKTIKKTIWNFNAALHFFSLDIHSADPIRKADK
jgi:hypothetical protein